jgi:hypothetical protein
MDELYADFSKDTICTESMLTSCVQYHILQASSQFEVQKSVELYLKGIKTLHGICDHCLQSRGAHTLHAILGSLCCVWYYGCYLEDHFGIIATLRVML